MAGGWVCPHEIDGTGIRVNDLPCGPGMKGRVLADKGKKRRLGDGQARHASVADAPAADESPGLHP